MKLLVFLLLPYLSLSEVGPDFNQCSQFFLNNDPPQITPPVGISVKHICQCVWVGIINHQKMYLYATLYNTTGRIPIYSAYVFGSQNVGRCDPWYIEPQLDLGNNADPCMSPQGHKRAIGNNQAVNRDYNSSGYDRGHLYPVRHTDNHLSMLATSTLTNSAPQNSKFNQNAWKKHEEDVIKDLKSCEDKAYVVTGVVPEINKTINNRVTVSKYYWRATCCKKNNTFTGQGYYGPDNNDKVQKSSIAALQTQLTKDYKVKNIIIFPNVPSPPGPSNPKKPRKDGCN